MPRYQYYEVCLRIAYMSIDNIILTTQTWLYISDKMRQVQVEKIEINVGLQINNHNVASVEINDHTNLICNCSKAVFVPMMII